MSDSPISAPNIWSAASILIQLSAARVCTGPRDRTAASTAARAASIASRTVRRWARAWRSHTVTPGAGWAITSRRSVASSASAGTRPPPRAAPAERVQPPEHQRQQQPPKGCRPGTGRPAAPRRRLAAARARQAQHDGEQVADLHRVWPHTRAKLRAKMPSVAIGTTASGQRPQQAEARGDQRAEHGEREQRGKPRRQTGPPASPRQVSSAAQRRLRERRVVQPLVDQHDRRHGKRRARRPPRG